jgi:hypothetical protein
VSKKSDKATIDKHIDGGDTIALKAEGRARVIPKWRLISYYRLADHVRLKD